MTVTSFKDFQASYETVEEIIALGQNVTPSYTEGQVMNKATTLALKTVEVMARQSDATVMASIALSITDQRLRVCYLEEMAVQFLSCLEAKQSR